MPQSLAGIYLHAVFSTRERVPYLRTPTERERMFALLAGISYRLDCRPVLVGGMADHVHVLFELARTISPAEWVKEVKRASSLAWKKEMESAGDFAWQHGYGMFSVSASHVERVREYIRNQEEHHKGLDFQGEFRALLTRYGIAWDEKYLWQ